jgi:hypothetical protein
LPELAPDVSAWDSVLTELELSLTVLTDGGVERSTWIAPVGLGPMPTQFAERARRLSVLQAEAIVALREAQRTVAKHLAVVDSVPNSRAHAPSAYLDVNG